MKHNGVSNPLRIAASGPQKAVPGSRESSFEPIASVFVSAQLEELVRCAAYLVDRLAGVELRAARHDAVTCELVEAMAVQQSVIETLAEVTKDLADGLAAANRRAEALGEQLALAKRTSIAVSLHAPSAQATRENDD